MATTAGYARTGTAECCDWSRYMPGIAGNVALHMHKVLRLNEAWALIANCTVGIASYWPPVDRDKSQLSRVLQRRGAAEEGVF